MRRELSFFLLLLLAATPALAQVQVDVRLEKNRYLAGEPVVVLVEVRNVGDEAVGYSTCDGDVRLQVLGAERRVPPNIFGCFSGIGSGGGCGIDHPPLLQPGQATTFRYLLKHYDLRPGQYQLSASGKAGVRWKYYPVYAPNLPPPPPHKHKETDPVPGAQFDQRLPLAIVTATQRELRDAFAPLVSDVDGNDPVQRHHARAAIVESAPPFLEPLIARFAAEDQYDTSAIDALGRIASTGSRTHLKNLVRSSREARRSAVVLALARVGHRDDADFLASILQDETIDQTSRRYAAFGLGHIGGDASVRHLERALDNVPPEVRPSVATALGNTRSRLAVPVLIGMFGNNPSRNDVCGALKTLTHRDWCDGTADDPAAKRRQWLRTWNDTKTPIFGPTNCPADRVATDVVPTPATAISRPAPSGPPRVSPIVPSIAAPSSVVAVSGYALGVEDSSSVQVLFRQGNLERIVKVSGSGRALSQDADNEFQYMDVVVPGDLTPGRWEIVINANGRRSAPVAIEIVETAVPRLTGVAPAQAHPAQGVLLTSKTPAQVGDVVELTDGRGRQWRIATGASALGISLMLPDEVADGEASIRLGRNVNGEERFSAPLRFLVTSGPLPLKSLAVALMKPVAPGQWTDIVKDHEIEFEVRRVDRIDVEFQQGAVTEISRATGPDNVHVQVPGRLIPGRASVRTRTWIEQTASDWSAPVTLTVPERPVAPSVTAIEAGSFRNLVWWSGDSAPAVAEVQHGEAMVLRGHFPVARATDLRVRLRAPGRDLELRLTDVDGGVRVEIPSSAASGDYRLVVEPKDGRTAPQAITTVRIR